ncbi:SIS domain-containing protein [Hyphococcus luteus]|uniref:Iron dicitrate transport regulator FecR n=1 Tax=Hyphococcus luteus TaxID=2058213 RepID=A0A2S7K9X1_9PROT|nr:SIS domain-containing protein [Marinicaulis flavus]PQA89306.1 iron dicitrate transport regulator FecR [Marinicaulis flavus]
MYSHTLMHSETLEIPQRVAEQVELNVSKIKKVAAHIRSGAPNLIVTCGRGSSAHAAIYAKYLFELSLGLPVASFAPSIASVYGANLKLEGALFLAVSQSGRSPDLIAAAESARVSGAYVVAVVNDEECPLSTVAHEVIPIRAGVENSVAATKTCVGAMSVLYDLCAELTRSQEKRGALKALPGTLKMALQCDWSSACAVMRTADQALIIGRGLGLSAASEAALKLKETCEIQAESYSAAEIKHGPMAIVRKGYSVIAAAMPDGSGASVHAIAHEFLKREANVYVVAARSKMSQESSGLHMPEAEEPCLQPLIFLQAFYLFANRLSIERGLNPDRPLSLQKVTETT